MAVETSPSDSAKYLAIGLLGGNVLTELLAAAVIPENAFPVGFRVLRDTRDSSQVHVEILCTLGGATEPRQCAVRVNVERLLEKPSPLLRKILEKFVVP
ncbi:MAG: hypothetical protein IT428_09170 [Planctomycetaceae bacterium]|nr:hypothetical protein [Planctomycetaceae bacterium]